MKYKVSVVHKWFGASVITLTPLTRNKRQPWGDLALIEGDIIEAPQHVKHVTGFDEDGKAYDPESIIDFRRDV